MEHQDWSIVAMKTKKTRPTPTPAQTQAQTQAQTPAQTS